MCLATEMSEMIVPRKGIVALWLIGMVAVATLSACAAFSAWLRSHTYPPGFTYITEEQLRSTMWQLAKDIRQLDRTVREPEEIDEQRRAALVKLLASMEQATAKLSREGFRSNHPLIDAHLPSFRRDIALARKGVEGVPPNYTLVALLPGACIYCHGSSD